MAYEVYIQGTATEEFERIVEYLSQFSDKAATKFKQDWYSSINSLKDGIIEYRLSRFENLAMKGFHSLLFNNYVMLYLEEDNSRYIAHIFHQKQNYAELV